ncbi:efflux RND transporter permease subunit [Treponema paraluiscuniculi]|nr:RND family transporter [Treponema paraluiscuniculi]
MRCMKIPRQLTRRRLLERFYAHPWVLVAVLGALTLFFAVQLRTLRLDNNNFRFIPKENSVRIADQRIDGTFGSQVPVLIGIKREYTSVVDPVFLADVRSLIERISAVPLVRAESTLSLLSAEYLGLRAGNIISERVVPDEFSGSAEEVQGVYRKLRDWDFYERNLVSRDLRSMQIVVFLDTSNEESSSPGAMAACRAIIRILGAWKSRDAQTFVTGATVFNEMGNEASMHDLTLLVPLVVLIIIVALFVSFRRLAGIFLPLLTVVISTVWALGAMALCAIPLSILSAILPVILIAVGSAYGIHIVSAYFYGAFSRICSTRQEHRARIVEAVDKIIQPVFLSALTTFVGFVSFCFTSVVPIFEFGVFASVGVASAFAVALMLIPSLLIIRGPESRVCAHAPDAGHEHMDTAITGTLMVIADHYRTVLFVAFLAVVFSLVGMSRLVIDNVLAEYFEPEVTVVQSDRFMQQHFGGSRSLTVLVSTPARDGSVARPDVLKAMDDLTEFLQTRVEHVGKVISLVPLIKRINQVYNADASARGLEAQSADVVRGGTDDFGVFKTFTGGHEEPARAETSRTSLAAPGSSYDFRQAVGMLVSAVRDSDFDRSDVQQLVQALEKAVNYDGRAYYEIPCDPKKYGVKTSEELQEIISGYLLLLSGKGLGLVDRAVDPRALKMNIQLGTKGQQDSYGVIEAVKKFIRENFPQDVHAEFGGSVLVEQSLNDLVVQSQLISLVFSLCVVFIIIAVHYRSLFAGIIGTLPLGVSVLVNFGVMGFFGIKLNICTAMVAGFSSGIGVDYTIHYLAAYGRVWKECGGKDFLTQTFYGSGRAILFNVLSVGSGFAVLMLSKFNVLADFGLLMVLAMLTSSVASLTLLPTLLNVVKPRFITR